MIYSKTNQTILAELDKVVYGHKKAKVALINLVNRSKMRYHQIWHSLAPIKEEDMVSNINCLLIGDSGTGKTHLIQSLAKICEFPLVIIDANQLAPTNASGGVSSEHLIKKIKRAAMDKLDANPDYRYFTKEGIMDQTIVFIDEIDKLANNFDSSGGWNKHVQANFLALFENNAELKNLSFIFAGAFADMKKREVLKTSGNIGFLNSSTSHTSVVEFDVEQEVLKYGLIPELVGRIHNIVVLDKLEDIDYKRIILKMLLPAMRKELKSFNIKHFKLTKDQLQSIIKKAKNSDMGVRVIKKELFKLAQDLEFEYEWNKGGIALPVMDMVVFNESNTHKTNRHREIMEVIFNQDPDKEL